MAVFREVIIAWGGADYTFTPSLRLVRRIDGLLQADDMTIPRVVYMAGKGKWPMGHMALIIGEVMRSAGAVVSDDDIYAELMNDPIGAIPLYNAVIECLSPTEPERKKDAADAK